MRLEVCEDREYLASVITDPEMWERISDDTQYVADFVVDSIKENWIFLKVVTMDGPIGFYCLHPKNARTWQSHAHILEPFREKYAMPSGRIFMEWMAQHLPKDIQKVIAEIPKPFQDVYHFAKKLGFKDEGINRASILVGGNLVDQYHLGITREEIYEWVS